MHIGKKLFVAYLALMTVIATANAEDDGTDGLFGVLKKKYTDLSPKGKLAAGATVGFVGSRLALKTVANVAKIGAAAFLT